MIVDSKNNYVHIDIDESEITNKQGFHSIGQMRVKHEDGRNSIIHFALMLDKRGNVVGEIATERGERTTRKTVTATKRSLLNF